MIKMPFKHKQPSLEAGLLIILMVIAIFSIGYYTESPTGMVSKEVTENMVMVTGMGTYTINRLWETPDGVKKVQIEYNGVYNIYKVKDPSKVTASDTTIDESNLDLSTSLVIDNRDKLVKDPYTTTTPPTTTQSSQTATSTPPPPPPGAPQPPTAPPTPPAPAPTKENIPINQLTKANDGIWYYKWPDGTLQMWERTTETWKDITYTYSLTVKDSAGATQVIRVEAPTLASAQTYSMPAGTTVINAVKVTDPSVMPTGTFTTTKIGGKDAVTNGQVTYFVPEGKTATIYVTELNDKARINDAYTQWRTGQNLADTPENRKLFRDYPPSGMDVTLIDATLGLKPAEEEKKEALPYTRIQLPDNRYMLKYDINGDGTIQDNEMFVQEGPEPTGTLQNLINFKTSHPTAVLQTNYMSDGNRVYLENGVYISEVTGAKINSMTETRDIGTTKATVYYTLKDGTAKKIDHVEINDVGGTQMDMDTFNQIKSSIKSGTAPSGSNGKITYTDKDGRTIEVDISTYKDEVSGVKDGIWEGTRAITTSSSVYLDAQGNQISKEKYDNLIKEGETLPNPIRLELIETEEFEKGVITKEAPLFGEKKTEDGQVLKTYTWTRTYFRDETVHTETTKIDAKTNELLEFTLKVYDKESSLWKKATLKKDGTFTDDSDEDLKDETRKRQSQFKSRAWFADFEFKLTQYKGLSGWSQLIFSDEELASWREGVDKLFSTFYLGTEYWTSAICSRYIPKGKAGLLTMQTPDKLFDVIAHVEGEKTIIPNPNGSMQYLYKLTLSVRNPKNSRYDKLKFNVYLHGQKTVQLYEQAIEVKDGESFTRGSGKREDGEIKYDEQHGKPIVQYSNYNYNKICIKFDSKILNAEGDREDTVCNAIVEYKGSPTKYQQRVTATTQGTPGAPGEPYQEADF